jgi:predicted RNA-binding protein with PUA domain
MNKIVREHYPKQLLPGDLRPGSDPDRRVTVTVVEEETGQTERPMTLDEILAVRRPPYSTAAEIDEDIRRGREEDAKA